MPPASRGVAQSHVALAEIALGRGDLDTARQELRRAANQHRSAANPRSGDAEDDAESIRDLEAALGEAERDQEEAGQRKAQTAGHAAAPQAGGASSESASVRRHHVRRWDQRDPLPAVGSLRPGVLRPTAAEFAAHATRLLRELGLSADDASECAELIVSVLQERADDGRGKSKAPRADRHRLLVEIVEVWPAHRPGHSPQSLGVAGEPPPVTRVRCCRVRWRWRRRWRAGRGTRRCRCGCGRQWSQSRGTGRTLRACTTPGAWRALSRTGHEESMDLREPRRMQLRVAYLGQSQRRRQLLACAAAPWQLV